VSPPLRVGLNLVYLVEQSGGAGTYARELIRAILEVEPETRITAFVSSEAPEWTRAADGFAAEVDWVRFPMTVTHGPPLNFARTMAVQWGALAWMAARRRLQVVHGLANITPLVAPRVATVVTVLDLIWIRWPHTMERRATVGMKMVTPPSAHLADRVIAISHAARDDLATTLRLRRDKIDVTHLGFRADAAHAAPAEEADVRARLGLGDGPVVLCVAQKREHKNLLGLIDALSRVRDRTTRLVLPGAPTPHEQALREAAAAYGVADRVILLDWLTAEDLEGLYRLATCFVLPSFEEGFGLPILEAMARDTPVACSNTSSLPEVAGDAALLFDPRDPADIAGCIDRLLADEDLRAELRDRGRAQVARFPWTATAEATLATYRRAVLGGAGGGAPR
jgi:glycosyltransferase involved in cell wall biosynthesis